MVVCRDSEQKSSERKMLFHSLALTFGGADHSILGSAVRENRGVMAAAAKAEGTRPGLRPGRYNA
jgi:hypothetical protein